MKNLKAFLPILLLTGLSLAVVSGCKKDDKADSDTAAAEDNSFAQRIFDDVKNMADQAADNNDLTTYRSGTPSILSNCATVTVDNTSNPHLITIDFGTTNCTCLDGRQRRGKIFISYVGAYHDSGSVHSITFGNYFVNDYGVTGTKTVTNHGTNTAGNLWFSIAVNATITAPNGNVMTWNSTRQREWTAGSSTLFNWLDDVYSISGNASGISFSGVAYTATITSPLIVALNCWWIKEGVLEIAPTGVQVREIDYGYSSNTTNGCDNEALVTIGSNTYVVHMH